MGLTNHVTPKAPHHRQAVRILAWAQKPCADPPFVAVSLRALPRGRARPRCRYNHLVVSTDKSEGVKADVMVCRERVKG